MTKKEKEEIRDIAKMIIMISFPDLDIQINHGQAINEDSRLIFEIYGLLEIIKKLGFDTSKEFNEVFSKIDSLLGDEDRPYITQVEDFIKENNSSREKLISSLANMYRGVPTDD
jgi:AraC-like DNA-binding protein